MSEISEYVKAVEDYQQIVHRRLWMERVLVDFCCDNVHISEENVNFVNDIKINNEDL